MVPGFSVFTATFVLPFHVPAGRRRLVRTGSLTAQALAPAPGPGPGPGPWDFRTQPHIPEAAGAQPALERDGTAADLPGVLGQAQRLRLHSGAGRSEQVAQPIVHLWGVGC